MADFEGKANIYQPREHQHRIKPENWEVLRQHYQVDPNDNSRDDGIIKKIYGGKPLNSLNETIQLEANRDEALSLKAKITLFPKVGTGLETLVIGPVLFKQFLVSGLPLKKWGVEWKGSYWNWNVDVDYWDQTLDDQYRLEICHSEVSRWSLLFKNGDKALDGVQLEGDTDISYIELINNCTTTKGFGFKLKFIDEDEPYHGSFGWDDPGGSVSSSMEDIYEPLSRRQAGSLAHQGQPLLREDPDIGENPFFFRLYSAKNGFHENAPIIDLSRYQLPWEGGAYVLPVRIYIERGCINYERWKNHPEYYQKPKERGLMVEIKSSEFGGNKKIPTEYQEIENAEHIIFPNFGENGVYEIFAPKEMISRYCWMYQLSQVILRPQVGGHFELELKRNWDPKDVHFKDQLLRVVLGNLKMESIPVYPEYWTMNRFGYGARETTMSYDVDWVLPMDPVDRLHYGYLLGGREGEEGDKYICPEGYGVERAVFSWKDKVGGILTLLIQLVLQFILAIYG